MNKASVVEKSVGKFVEEVVGRGWESLWERGSGGVRVVRFGGKVFGFVERCSVLGGLVVGKILKNNREKSSSSNSSRSFPRAYYNYY